MDIIPHALNTRPTHRPYSIGEVTHSIKNKKLGKPYIQRKKVWKLKDVRSWITNVIRERIDYRGFLINKRDTMLYVWDGNNRVNAIHYFKSFPLKVFPEFIVEFFGMMPAVVSDYLKSCSYEDIIHKKSLERLLMVGGSAECMSWYDANRGTFIEDDNGFDKLQDKFREWDIDNVQIFAAEWENATDTEMAERYGHANRNGAPLTELDLLAASTDKIRFSPRELGEFHPFIRDNVDKYYENDAGEEDKEVLSVCFDSDGELNLFQVLLGFQAHMRTQYPLVVPASNGDVKRDMLFDLYSYMSDDDDFTRKVNILEFMTKVADCCRMVSELCQRFKLSEIKNKAVKKGQVGCMFEKNNILRVLGLAYMRHGDLGDAGFRAEILRIIFYHECLKGVKGSTEFHECDYLAYKAGGAVIPKNMKAIKEGRGCVVASSEQFRRLLAFLLAREVKSCGAGQKVRKGTCSEFVANVLNLVYNHSVPLALKASQADEFDHIVPFSSVWDAGVEVDINRPGNMAAIDKDANRERGNRSITDEFVEKHLKFYNYPSEAEYKAICEERKVKRTNIVTIRDVEGYNTMCERREAVLIQIVLKALGW